jgi:hypothetical protein
MTAKFRQKVNRSGIRRFLQKNLDKYRKNLYSETNFEFSLHGPVFSRFFEDVNGVGFIERRVPQ